MSETTEQNAALNARQNESPAAAHATETSNVSGIKLYVGLDIGSTTAKVAAIDAATNELVFARYVRHHAAQFECALGILEELNTEFPGTTAFVAVTGSGARPIAKALGVPYIQEVVANGVAIAKLHPEVRTAIELGGQDAKIIFFGEPNKQDGKATIKDMRMNGSCAGGTGAFIDEIATLLAIPIEEFNTAASKGETVYAVSGRCGVFAKTDIQPLINQGALKEDIALSTFHAIAKQTIGGLAQGMEIEAPIIFEGGPLTFNPRLVEVFKERLGINAENVIVPEHAELMVAMGAALSSEEDQSGTASSLQELISNARAYQAQGGSVAMESDQPSLNDKPWRSEPLFANEEDKAAFDARHELPEMQVPEPINGIIDAWLGIDSGSTTTKLVLLDNAGTPFDSFYASNKGEPLEAATKALIALRKKYEEQGITLNIRGAGCTGYGEPMFASAYGCDHHMVETVAHAHAAQAYLPNVNFVLDIGGQDMKAIWMEKGIITDIVMNEACSSGCGSFLESFASALGIPIDQVAEVACSSKEPAVLGSRCTVFMNSSIITEQRNGKKPEDIMAGLCTSIIENVFTKVIRINNTDALGKHIMVQGGTFRNDAVLRAFERYLDREVTRAPYPGLMGAIGAALLTKEQIDATGKQTTFIGLDALDDFSYERETDLICPHCANQCNRTLLRFSNGTSWITGNRCSKGGVPDNVDTKMVDEPIESVASILRVNTAEKPVNLFDLREKLLFKDYPVDPVLPPQGKTIGLPRVLSLWDTAPFWRTFFEALGFKVRISRSSTRKLYESGLSGVASDTVCFPAKLVHGHVKALAAAKPDRIFMPIIAEVEPEGTADTAESMCAVVKGYAYVMRASDNPEEHYEVPFDTPLFHWYTKKDRTKQLSAWCERVLGIDASAVRKALEQADKAQESFKAELLEAGQKVLADVEKAGTYAVVLASRPYQNDKLVNHDIPKMFTDAGVSVLCADALPGLNDVDLSDSRLDIPNNYHARMLAAAIIVATTPHLEYAQIVSFGCGHDAYLSDEIVRLMGELSDTAPLILKVDESSAGGPLQIRIRSFLETLQLRHEKNVVAENSFLNTTLLTTGVLNTERPHSAARKSLMKAISTEKAIIKPNLPDPYRVKYTQEHLEAGMPVLVPNTSHAFGKLMAATFSTQGPKCIAVDIGRERAIELGKRYVHNDICFPAQMVIGECLEALMSGKYDTNNVAVAMAKYVGDCRLTHYSALLRKALDDAGFAHVPIITNDDADAHNMHPAFKFNLRSAMLTAYALPMIDVLEELLRKIRPYELVPGSAEAAFEEGLDAVIDGVASGVPAMNKGFKHAIELFKNVEYDRSNLRPKVLIVGEFLLNFHPGANHDIELYLENHGFEIIEARMTDVIRKTYFYKHAQSKEYKIDKPLGYRAINAISDMFFTLAHNNCDRIAVEHPLIEPPVRMPELVQASDGIIHHTFDAGEGVLIPAEIIHHAEHGVKSFVILQPFGCLPNHIVGRGIVKALKERYPDTQILALDYDPDVSFANIENRLQMLVMNEIGRVNN